MRYGRAQQLKRYLLGLLPAEETGQFDEEIARCPVTSQKLRLVEVDLIDEFLDGSLSEDEKTAFRANYLVTRPRMQRFRLASGLRRLAASQRDNPNRSSVGVSANRLNPAK